MERWLVDANEKAVVLPSFIPGRSSIVKLCKLTIDSKCQSDNGYEAFSATEHLSTACVNYDGDNGARYWRRLELLGRSVRRLPMAPRGTGSIVVGVPKPYTLDLTYAGVSAAGACSGTFDSMDAAIPIKINLENTTAHFSTSPIFVIQSTTDITQMTNAWWDLGSGREPALSRESMSHVPIRRRCMYVAVRDTSLCRATSAR